MGIFEFNDDTHVEEERAKGSADSDRPAESAMHPDIKTQKAAFRRSRKAKGHGKERIKRLRKNKTKTIGKHKQARTEVKAEEKPVVPKMNTKRKQLN